MGFFFFIYYSNNTGTAGKKAIVPNQFVHRASGSGKTCVEKNTFKIYFQLLFNMHALKTVTMIPKINITYKRIKWVLRVFRSGFKYFLIIWRQITGPSSCPSCIACLTKTNRKLKRCKLSVEKLFPVKLGIILSGKRTRQSVSHVTYLKIITSWCDMIGTIKQIIKVVCRLKQRVSIFEHEFSKDWLRGYEVKTRSQSSLVAFPSFLNLFLTWNYLPSIYEAPGMQQNTTYSLKSLLYLSVINRKIFSN